MQVWCSACAASVADRFDFRMRGRVVLIPDAVDPAPDYCAVPVNDKSGEGNPAIVDMVHGEGDRRLHELAQGPGMFRTHQAVSESLALSASFSQTTPAIMTPSQTAWINVSG
ncbi:hypothetical protein LAB1_51020 [Roseibium sp. LAB1]